MATLWVGLSNRDLAKLAYVVLRWSAENKDEKRLKSDNVNL